MFGLNRHKNSKLEEEIDRVLLEMNQYGPDSPEYPKLLETLERLNRMQSQDKPRISRDTVLVVVGNVACVLIIVAYEQHHVVTSRAATFFARLTNRAHDTF